MTSDRQTPDLYSEPLFYDIAFSAHMTENLEHLLAILSIHCQPFPRRLLAPACGTGRYLRALARQGMGGYGYDRNPTLVKFAQKALKAAGFGRAFKVTQHNMVDPIDSRRCEIAINMGNSIGYLETDQALVEHLTNTRKALKVHAPYIVQFTPPGVAESSVAVLSWQAARDDVAIDCWWQVVEERPETKQTLFRSYFTVRRDKSDAERVLDDTHLLRHFTIRDLADAGRQAGFDLVGAYAGDRRDLLTSPADAAVSPSVTAVLRAKSKS